MTGTVGVQPAHDQKRDVGLRGDDFSVGVGALVLVFLTGFALLAIVLRTRRKEGARPTG